MRIQVCRKKNCLKLRAYNVCRSRYISRPTASSLINNQHWRITIRSLISCTLLSCEGVTESISWIQIWIYNTYWLTTNLGLQFCNLHCDSNSTNRGERSHDLGEKNPQFIKKNWKLASSFYKKIPSSRVEVFFLYNARLCRIDHRLVCKENHHNSY